MPFEVDSDTNEEVYPAKVHHVEAKDGLELTVGSLAGRKILVQEFSMIHVKFALKTIKRIIAVVRKAKKESGLEFTAMDGLDQVEIITDIMDELGDDFYNLFSRGVVNVGRKGITEFEFDNLLGLDEVYDLSMAVWNVNSREGSGLGKFLKKMNKKLDVEEPPTPKKAAKVPARKTSGSKKSK